MGGVAGHAGLFSTGDDLAKFAQALLNGGGGILSALSVEKMTRPEQPPSAPVLRGFGWDIDSPFSSNRGDLLPVGSYGHTGFTGTSMWIDPTTQTYIILLTNTVHPRGKGNAIALRSKVATAVAAALPLTASEKEALRWQSITGYNEAQSAARHMSARNGSVKTGIDVLEEHGFDVLQIPGRKKKIGLVTNQTGLDADGRRTIDVLAQAPGVSLDAIFSPEHGVTGTLDTTDVSNSKDAATGIPVYSVYGAKDAARRPPPDVIKQLDAIVFDIQDAGVRFYTYETTLGYFLEAAASAGVELIVLDRPDPITGSFVQGPVADAGRESFTNYWTVPPRHGMTLGELAKMFNAERNINAKLTVVAMEGWQRGDWFDSTGLAWVNPSPNLRSVTEAGLYPGVGLIEGTNVSVGRGTDTPFELLGAPWMKSRELATYLNGRGIAGVRFVPLTFTPTASNYAGQKILAELAQPVRKRVEDPEPSRREGIPDFVDAGFHRVRRRLQVQAQFAVHFHQCAAVDLRTAQTARIYYARDPIPHRLDAGGVDHRLRLRVVILMVQIRDSVLAVERAPHRRRAVPAHIQGVAARPVRRNIEARDDDLGLGHAVDGARAQLRNALGARVALIGRRGSDELRLGRFVEVRHLRPVALCDMFHGSGFLVLRLQETGPAQAKT